MSKNRMIPAIVIAVSVGALCTHMALSTALPARSASISYGFFVAWSLLAVIVCSRRALVSPPGLRGNWTLLTLALLLWCVATVIAANAQFFEHLSSAAVGIDDLFYLSFGVPLLLAIVSPDDRQSIRLFFWLDVIQACALCLLAYVALFGAVPLSGEPLHPLPVRELVGIFDVEHVTLAVLATLRLLVSTRASNDQRFFRILSGFLWVYVFTAGIYNHIEATADDAGIFDVLLDLPFLVIIVAVVLEPIALRPLHGPARRTMRTLFIDNVRPALLGFSLVAVSAWVAQQHFKLALVVILGAFLFYGVRSSILQSRFAQTERDLERARDRLEQLVLQDGLTGIANRRCFDQRFQQEWTRARRTGTCLSLLLIDIDHFKRLNDTLGHLRGDECLVQVAQTLQQALHRPGDLLARYGGEEFVALLPETDDSGVINVAERLQNALDRSQPASAVEEPITVSIGATTWVPRRGATQERMLQAADRALYTAKQNGRNRAEYLPLELAQH